MRYMQQYQLSGLNAINDAEQIEDELQKIEGLETCYVDFVHQKLIIPQTHVSRRLLKRINDTIEKLQINITIQKEHFIFEIIYISLFIILLVAFIFTLLMKQLDILPWMVTFFGMLLLFFPQKKLFDGKAYFLERCCIFVASILLLIFQYRSECLILLIFYHLLNVIDLLMMRCCHHLKIDTDHHIFQYANMKQENHIIQVPVRNVKIDDIIYVKPHELIPVDGIIIDGKSSLQNFNSSQKIETYLHMEVFSGMKNLNGVIAIQVTKDFAHSKFVKLLEYQRRSFPQEKKLEKGFKKIFTVDKLVIFIFAIILVALFIFFPQKKVNILWIVGLLLLSCVDKLFYYILKFWEDSLVMMKSRGIYLCDKELFNQWNKSDGIVFDLEHTIAYGNDMVTKIVNYTRYTNDEFMYYIACAEEFSFSKIALAIKKYYKKRINTNDLHGYQELSGLGIKVEVNDKTILVGNENLLTKHGIWIESQEEVGTILHVAIDKEYAGYIVIRDDLKPNMIELIKKLKKAGLKHMKVISSNVENLVTYLCNELHMKEYLFNLTDQQKLNVISEWSYHFHKKLILVTNHSKLLNSCDDVLKVAIYNDMEESEHITNADIIVPDCDSIYDIQMYSKKLKHKSYYLFILLILFQFLAVLLYSLQVIPIYGLLIFPFFVRLYSFLQIYFKHH